MTKQSIVKMGRNEGELLVRMKNEYSSLGANTPNFSSILVPDDQAENMKRFGQNYSVTTESKPSDVFTGLAFTVIPASNVPSSSPNHDDMVINQGAATIAKVDDSNYTVSADFSKLVKYASETGQGEAYWLGIAIATGESTIVGLTFGAWELGASDVADATAVGLPAGSIAFYLRLEGGDRKVLIGKSGKETVINIKVVNTAEA